MCEGYLLISIYTGEGELNPNLVDITEYSVTSYDRLRSDVKKLLHRAATSSAVNLDEYDVDADVYQVENAGYIQIGDVYIEIRRMKK